MTSPSKIAQKTVGFQKGYTPWNKGKNLSMETRKKMLNRIPWNKGRIGINVGDKCPSWKGGKKSKECKNCKKTYEVYPYRKLNSSFCSVDCRVKFPKKKPNRWKGGSALKKNLWFVFSRYIRLRDQGICISCGVQKEIKMMDAGHYIPKTAGLSIYFHEKNVNCQCTYCNRWMHGNLSRYAIALRRKHGEGILEELDEIRKKTVQISSSEYQELIKHYKSKVSSLERNG